MTLTRIYIPLNAARLLKLATEQTLEDMPLLAYAVTDAVRIAAPTAGQDGWEYSALSDAVRRSAALLAPGEKRRIVAAADVVGESLGTAALGDDVDESAVSVLDSVVLKRIASFHVDDDDAAEDDELLWYDVTELPVILALL